MILSSLVRVWILEEMETMLIELAEASEKSGLKMNMQKTKIMTRPLVPQKRTCKQLHHRGSRRIKYFWDFSLA